MNQEQHYDKKIDEINQKLSSMKQSFENFLNFFQSNHIVFFNERSQSPMNLAVVQFKDGILYIPHDQLESVRRPIQEEDLFWVAHELSHAILSTDKQLFSAKNFGFSQSNVFKQFNSIIKNEAKTFALQFNICKKFIPDLSFDLFIKKETIIIRNTFIDAFCDSPDDPNDEFQDPFIFAEHVQSLLEAKIKEEIPNFENINLLTLKNNLVQRLEGYSPK